MSQESIGETYEEGGHSVWKAWVAWGGHNPPTPGVQDLFIFGWSCLTYLNSFTGVLQLTDHSLDSVIASHEDSDAITELRLMKGREACKILGVF